MFPFELVVSRSFDVATTLARIIRLGRVIRSLRLLKHLRLLRVPRLLQNLSQRISKSGLHLVALVVAALLLTHLAACAFYYIARVGAANWGWPDAAWLVVPCLVPVPVCVHQRKGLLIKS